MYSDDVRKYCVVNVVEPARAKGEIKVKIRVGDIHRLMGYKNRLPLVCSALCTNIFEEEANVRRLSVEGPINGANCILEFEVLV